MTKKLAKVTVLASLIILALVIGKYAHAADFSLVNCAAGNDHCTLNDLFHIVIKIINFLIGLSSLIAIMFVFWGAYGLATSYGNTEKIEGGKKIIQNAVVGFVLVLLAFLLINWLVLALGGYTLNDLIKFLPFT
jgi:hypothetical protein